MVDHTAELIGQAVIGDVDQNEQIITTDGFVDHTLCFAGAEPRALCVDDKCVAGISLECDIIFMLVLTFLTPVDNILIYFLTDLRAAL